MSLALSSDDVFHGYYPDGKVVTEYYEDWTPVTNIRGPVGSGKTMATLHKGLVTVMNTQACKDGVRRSKGGIVRNTRDDIERTVLPDFMEVFGDYGVLKRSSPMRFIMEVEDSWGRPVESDILFLSLDLPKAEKLLRGMQLTFLLLNEVNKLLRSNVSTALQRTGRYPPREMLPNRPSLDPSQGGDYRVRWFHDFTLPYDDERNSNKWYGAFTDCNSYGRNHWLAQQKKKNSRDWAFHNQPGAYLWDERVKGWALNPHRENQRYLDSGYYPRQLAMAVSEDAIKADLANLDVTMIDGEPVHKSFSDSVHCDTSVKYVAGYRVYAGLDFGRTPAIVLFHIIEGQYRVFYEFVTSKKKQMSADRLGIEARLAITRDVWPIPVGGIVATGDPSGNHPHETSSMSAIQHMNDEGWNVVPSPIPNNNTYARRLALSGPLTRVTAAHEPAIVINPETCPVLVEGLSGGWYYRRVQIAYDERYKSEPEKDNDYSHVCEALENGLAGVGEGMTGIGTVDDRDDKPLSIYHGSD